MSPRDRWRGAGDYEPKASFPEVAKPPPPPPPKQLSPPPPVEDQIIAIMAKLSMTRVPQVRVSYGKTPDGQGYVCGVSKIGQPDLMQGVGVDREGAARALLKMMIEDVRTRHATMSEILSWFETAGGFGGEVIDATFEES